ncbi:eukaryotic translation initiation factor 2D [Musca vetustissima]|uniref:eukaryotic translation initiation factor 2D n=1 Tax=Musca vetustissima TaxID=27455 RepID=UPI002AB7EB28|nr:eukaryotic translation initiation factor 2D [Musca vetustissima]
MFLKSFKLKSNTPLKASEAKKLRLRLSSEYPDTDCDILIPPKSNVTVLKLVTSGEIQTTVYCVDKLPFFFENEEKKLVPTLYALWKIHDLLPYFTTHPAVLPKLKNGADLMLPGVVTHGKGGMSVYGHYKKGQLVAVNLTSNKYAVGVGYLPRSSEDLYMCGGHGVAVKILHLFGDKLWGIEPQLAQQVPEFKTTLSENDFPELGKKTNPKKNEEVKIENLDNEKRLVVPLDNLNIKDESLQETSDNLPPENKETIDGNENILATNNEENTNDVISPELILKNAFLSALKNHGKSLQLPLLTSNFYRLYVVPEAQQAIDLKKTKYKKLSNFLNEMIDEGFIVVKEETKGVDKITYIDLEHPELVNFITDYKKPTGNGEGTMENALFHSELMELYTVTDNTAPFFTKLNYKRGEGIPASKIKKVIREYINMQNLPLSKDTGDESKTYLLDDCLQTICKSKSATLSNIIAHVTSQMEHSYKMCTATTVSSNKPMIQMSLATRSGNKKVTLVSNIEAYGIILPEFIKLCKQGAAASTTIVSVPNQKAELLQIQGNQVRFIYNLLTEKYKIPPKNILGLELAKDGKKHKKK